jgi:hypothetical protein
MNPPPCPNPNGSDLLGPGNASEDLVVKNGTCMVQAGTYLYHNINIIKGGTLQFADAAITLSAANIIIENQGTMRAGADNLRSYSLRPWPPLKPGRRIRLERIRSWGRRQCDCATSPEARSYPTA